MPAALAEDLSLDIDSPTIGGLQNEYDLLAAPPADAQSLFFPAHGEGYYP